MTWIALGGLALVALLLGARAFAGATVEQAKVALAVLAAILGAGLLALLLLRPREPGRRQQRRDGDAVDVARP
jgi:hypothetical protein